MKTTDKFKQVIKYYLDTKAQSDAEFAVHYNNEKKNIDDCITYLLNKVKKMNVVGLTDEETYDIAVSYYTAENVVVGDPIKCNVVINTIPELTEEEKQAAKQKAMDLAIAEQKILLQKKKVVHKQVEQQQSLF
jgi:hypothetical protein